MRTITHWSMRAFLALSIIFAAISLPATSFAQSDDDRAAKVEQLSADATKAYRAGEFGKAVELFKEAYGIEPVPNLLFNIAKSYEKMENWDQAITYYEKFVVEEGISKKARQSALTRVDELKEIRDRQKESGETKTADKTDDKPKTDEKAAPKPAEGGSNTAAWVAIGTGAALLAGGGVFGVVASGKQSEFEDATSAQDKVDARDSGETMALIADVMYISGAVVGGIGIYLLLTGDDGETETASAFPWVSKDAAGFGVRTNF